MELVGLSLEDVQLLRDNYTSSADKNDPFWRCFAHTDCGGCLDTRRCSWCPYTWACIPNPYKIPLLAPAYDKHVCPARDERWELRTRPLGCNVSTRTSLSVIIAVVSTFLLIALLCLLVLGIQRLRGYSKEHPGWWRFWNRPWWLSLREFFWKQDDEREPLLSANQPVQVAPEHP